MNILENTPSFVPGKKEAGSERALAEIIKHIADNSYLKVEEIPAASAKDALAWYEQQVGFSRDNEQSFPQEDVDALRELVKKEEEAARDAVANEPTREIPIMPQEPAKEASAPQEAAITEASQQIASETAYEQPTAIPKGELRQKLTEIRRRMLDNSYLREEKVPSTSAQDILAWYEQQIAFDPDNKQHFPEKYIVALRDLAKKEQEL